MSAALRRRHASVMAVSRPSSAPCQTNCTSAQPSACATGRRTRASIMLISILPVVGTRPVVVGGRLAVPGAAVVEEPPDFAELLRAGAPCGERLHHELRRGPSERAVQQVADQLTLGVGLGHAGLIDVGPIALVAPHQSLFCHY